MAGPNDLTTLGDAMPWVGLDSDPVLVARLITSVSTAIQNWLGYNIASATYTNLFNGDGGRALIVPDRPLTNVASVLVDGIINVPAQSLPQTFGFSWNDCAVYLSGHYRFTRGFQNVQVTYTAGYSTVPGDIEQACLDWLKIMMTGQDFDTNASEIRAGDTMMRRDISQMLPPPAVAAALYPYRLVF